MRGTGNTVKLLSLMIASCFRLGFPKLVSTLGSAALTSQSVSLQPALPRLVIANVETDCGWKFLLSSIDLFDLLALLEFGNLLGDFFIAEARLRLWSVWSHTSAFNDTRP